MQPLHVGFVAPLKTYYAQEIETFFRNNPHKIVTNSNICSLFGKAYNRAVTMMASITAFKKTGLQRCNRNIFKKIDFSGANQHQPGQFHVPDVAVNDMNLTKLRNNRKPGTHNPLLPF